MIEAGKDYLFIDGDSDISADRIEPGPHADIGVELRAAREARGLDLAPVALDLRIREQYLRSLESGAYDDLPGIPYAIGFVRSYAEFLRLDPDDMVRRFKAEAKGGSQRSHLAFPQPVRYGRLPGVALIALSLVFAGLLYGGWYLYGASRTDSSGATTAGGDMAKAREAATGADNVAAGAAGKKVADTAVGGASGGRDAADGARGADAGAKRSAKNGDDASGSADGAAKDPSVGRSATTSGAPTSPSTGPTTTPPASAADKKAPALVAALPKDDQIVLRATANAWVQIKDRQNRIVFVKVLRAGDTYKVPKQDGLIMNVGNAGGLRIVVGGTQIKPLGPTNIPVFNVSLDPRALLEHRR